MSKVVCGHYGQDSYERCNGFLLFLSLFFHEALMGSAIHDPPNKQKNCENTFFKLYIRLGDLKHMLVSIRDDDIYFFF